MSRISSISKRAQRLKIRSAPSGIVTVKVLTCARNVREVLHADPKEEALEG